MAERRHPDWIKVRAPASVEYFETKGLLKRLALHTVCEEACCPNIGECWSHHTATFMLMGDVCTRNCPYCAVAHGKVAPLDPEEPRRVAEAVQRLRLKHVVVTSVDRDDLQDCGAGHFSATAVQIKLLNPDTRVELLVPDFKGVHEHIERVTAAPVDIYNHNTETVPRLYKTARPGGRYDRCLDVLAHARKASRRLGRNVLTKTGLMLGLGESFDEVRMVLADLREVECDILTMGQYLQPSKEHLPVARYVTPAEFADLREEALGMGFRHVESGPLVRSSYHAWEHVN